MKIEIANRDEWIIDQVNMLLDESKPKFTSKEDIEAWLNKTDLIQILTENFDYDVEITDKGEISNEEFYKQFNELFQSLKKEIINKLWAITNKN